MTMNFQKNKFLLWLGLSNLLHVQNGTLANMAIIASMAMYFLHSSSELISRYAVGMTTVSVANMGLDVDFQREVILRQNKSVLS